MAGYLVRRVLAMALTLFVIVTLAFMAVRLMPGSVYDDPDLPPAVQEALEARLHLDKPVWAQYGYFLRGVLLEGDWGTSVKLEPGVPAFKVLRSRIPISLLINALSLAVALPLGMAAGTAAALGRGRGADRAVSLGVVVCLSVPSFVLAAGLQYFAAYRWGLFPIVFQPAARGGVLARSLVLPVAALALGPMATVARYMRGEMAEALGAEYMSLAKAKGLSRRAATVGHALRNACVPLITVVAPMLANVLGGSLVIEGIFAIPGVGGTLIDAINARDHTLTVAALLFYSAVSLATMLLADVCYGLVDPRIKMGARA